MMQIYNLRNYWDLTEMASELGSCDFDDIYDDDQKDEFVNDLAVDWARENTWQDLLEMLQEVPTGSEFYRYSYGEWTSLDDDDFYSDRDDFISGLYDDGEIVDAQEGLCDYESISEYIDTYWNGHEYTDPNYHRNDEDEEDYEEYEEVIEEYEEDDELEAEEVSKSIVSDMVRSSLQSIGESESQPMSLGDFYKGGK